MQPYCVLMVIMVLVNTSRVLPRNPGVEVTCGLQHSLPFLPFQQTVILFRDPPFSDTAPVPQWADGSNVIIYFF